MITPTRSVSDNRAIAYGVSVLAALTVLKFGFFIPALGIFVGVLLSLHWVVGSEGEDAPMGVALLVIAAGVLLFAGAIAASFWYEIPLTDLDHGRKLRRFIESLPFLSGTLVAAGSFLVLANLLGRPKETDAPG